MAQQNQTAANSNAPAADGREKLYTHSGTVSGVEFLTSVTGTPYVKATYAQQSADGKVSDLVLMAFGKALDAIRPQLEAGTTVRASGTRKGKLFTVVGVYAPKSEAEKAAA